MIPILFGGEVLRKIRQLQRISGTKLEKEVVRDAIVVYAILVVAADEKGELIVSSMDGSFKRKVTVPKRKAK